MRRVIGGLVTVLVILGTWVAPVHAGHAAPSVSVANVTYLAEPKGLAQGVVRQKITVSGSTNDLLVVTPRSSTAPVGTTAAVWLVGGGVLVLIGIGAVLWYRRSRRA